MAFKSYSQNFTKRYQVVFEKIHFTSPPLWKILRANLTENPPKNPFNFDSIKNSFWVHKVSGINILFPNFIKSYWVVFEKKLFISPPLWKFLSPNVTAKHQKNPLNFDSIQNSFWVHKVTGIRMLFTRFCKTSLSSFCDKFTLLHLPYENF